ncbi:unnamed protein product [Didymodactylos carnosus]|uniref:Riboflavin transporter n=1 Tax=Didymodactylos carnosus TaxID=1234261 RepID=A0A814NJW3_9BILA|nr:unnamed protein product [Didymodactylos carnosus]CAF3858489.1 unnamed protein product [Didymodactylos carnosus]
MVTWASRLTYILIIILNISTWLDLQGIWIELPLIIPYAPEAWSLPSILSIITCSANIFPLLIILHRRVVGSEKFSAIPYIYAVIIVGVISCLIIALFWDKTVFIFHHQRSLILLLATFFLSMLDCSSTVIYSDYMKHFRAYYLNAMFFGESLTCFIPTIIAIVQGVGGEIVCQNVTLSDNSTALAPTYSQPRFSVSVYFFILTVVIMCSLCAFIILRWSPVTKIADASVQDDEIQLFPDVAQDTPTMEQNVIRQTPGVHFVLLKNDYHYVLLLTGINAFVFIGCLPSMITYSLLPYGQRAFYYGSILAPLAYPFACFINMFIKLNLKGILFLSLINIINSLFIMYIAFTSPCPVLHDTKTGALLLNFVWIITSFCFGYIRVRCGNIIRESWSKEGGLFNFGLTFLIGGILGTVPFFFIINVFKLLNDRKPCIRYCRY